MQLIPAIDIRGGRCVRLSQGDYAQEKVYNDDPVVVAEEFEAQGAARIHIVDLDGAKSGHPDIEPILKAIVNHVSIPIQVGGGVRTLETARALLELGVERVIVGTVLAKDEKLAHQFFEEFGDRVISGIDARDGKVAVQGWTEGSDLDVFEFTKKMQDAGCKRAIMTDIARDGMLQGPNLEFFEKATSLLDLKVIASGGVSSLEDLQELAKIKPPVEGVIVGKAIYEGRFKLPEALAAL